MSKFSIALTRMKEKRAHSRAIEVSRKEKQNEKNHEEEDKERAAEKLTIQAKQDELQLIASLLT